MIVLQAHSIDFFLNLAQLDIGDKYFDFHNDYNCVGVEFLNGNILLVFISFQNKKVTIKFEDVIIEKFNFFRVEKNEEFATIDNIYRGRAELNGTLLDIDSENRAYFYIDFYDEQNLEIWAKSITVIE